MVVRMRSTRSHTGHRRSHDALSAPTISMEAGSIHLRHTASAITGTYKGRPVKSLIKKIERATRRAHDRAKAEVK